MQTQHSQVRVFHLFVRTRVFAQYNILAVGIQLHRIPTAIFIVILGILLSYDLPCTHRKAIENRTATGHNPTYPDDPGNPANPYRC